MRSARTLVQSDSLKWEYEKKAPCATASLQLTREESTRVHQPVAAPVKSVRNG